MTTMMKLTVGQFRQALQMEKPVLQAQASQDKIRMEHYMSLHPEVSKALRPLLDGRANDDLMLGQSFWFYPANLWHPTQLATLSERRPSRILSWWNCDILAAPPVPVRWHSKQVVLFLWSAGMLGAPNVEVQPAATTTIPMITTTISPTAIGLNCTRLYKKRTYLTISLGLRLKQMFPLRNTTNGRSSSGLHLHWWSEWT